MPESSSSVAEPVARASEAPADPDGWRPTNGAEGLPALRAELDRIDDALHDLLIERARVVEDVARSGKPAAFRPGREASIIRRLLARHQGKLPPVTLSRIWRELLAGTTAMQGSFVVAVASAEGGSLTRLAREHFGALTPLRASLEPEQALAAVEGGAAAVAVLPEPGSMDPWWRALGEERQLYIVARLPFWAARPGGVALDRAVVVAATPPDASGDDRSFVVFEIGPDATAARIGSELAAVGLLPERIVFAGPREHGRVLIEVNGMLGADDPRLLAAGPVLRRPVVAGGYAAPVEGTP